MTTIVVIVLLTIFSVYCWLSRAAYKAKLESTRAQLDILAKSVNIAEEQISAMEKTRNEEFRIRAHNRQEVAEFHEVTIEEAIDLLNAAIGNAKLHKDPDDSGSS